MNMQVMGFADAQAAYPFVIAQGRNIETRIYQKKYPAFEYASVVPVVTEGNQWASGTTFFTVDATGQAKFLSGAANDMPFSAVTRDQASHDFAMIGSGWEWNVEEINQASMYGIALTDTKAMAASQAIERKLYDIAMTGATEKNWQGFANQTSGVPRADVAQDASTSSELWSAKTPAEILFDMHKAVWTVSDQTRMVEKADTLALPPEAMAYVTITYVGTEGTSPTILERFKATHPGVDVIEVPALATAAAGQKGRMVAYRRDPEVLRFHLPMARTVLQARQKSIMAYETGIIARTGGTEIRLPKAMAYFDLITATPSWA